MPNKYIHVPQRIISYGERLQQKRLAKAARLRAAKEAAKPPKKPSKGSRQWKGIVTIPRVNIPDEDVLRAEKQRTKWLGDL